MSETVEVELRCGRVYAPATTSLVTSAGTKPLKGSGTALRPWACWAWGLAAAAAAVRMARVVGRRVARVVDVGIAAEEERCRAGRAAVAGAAGAAAGEGLGSAARARAQGLTLLHFPAQPEPLIATNSTHRPMVSDKAC